jgi:hypothetical protein
MDLLEDFRFTSVSHRVEEKSPANNLLGPLGVLKGTWKGRGFNQIWRPFQLSTGQDRFLELNETYETLTFEEIPGDIPNRGLLQIDINLHGLRYLQQVQDANALGPDGNRAGIHVEHGMWLAVPLTTDPNDPFTVVRLATIPHGVSLAAQGTALPPQAGAPTIEPISIAPFGVPAGNPLGLAPLPGNNTVTPNIFLERDLSVPTNFRTAATDIPHVTQDMVDNPNSVLTQGLQGKNVISTVTLTISTVSPNPVPNVVAPPQPISPQQNPPVVGGQPTTGGGIANIAFLIGAGNPNPTPNAFAARMDAVFYIEMLQEADGKIKHQLQYSQRVFLNFNNLTWPHVSVATLIKQE